MPKKVLTVRLSDEGRRLLNLLAYKSGSTGTAAIEAAIRDSAQKNKVK